MENDFKKIYKLKFMIKRLTTKILCSFYSKILYRDYYTRLKISKFEQLKELGIGATWTIPLSWLDKSSICYLVGAGEDISFDLELSSHLNCEIHIFDPTPKAWNHFQKIQSGDIFYENGERKIAYARKTHDSIKFHKLGLWSNKTIIKFYAPKDPKHVSHSITNLQKTEDYFEAEVDTLSNIMLINGHQYLDLLKLDIEGAEYEVLDFIINNKIKIKILCIEFDELFHNPTSVTIDKVRKYIIKLQNSGLNLVFASGNGNYTFINENANTN
jgi:FkbM family methyltransferase